MANVGFDGRHALRDQGTPLQEGLGVEVMWITFGISQMVADSYFIIHSTPSLSHFFNNNNL